MSIVLFPFFFNNTVYLFKAVLISVNVINYSIEPHSFHTTPQSFFMCCGVVFGTQRYDDHLVGLTPVEVFFLIASATTTWLGPSSCFFNLYFLMYSQRHLIEHLVFLYKIKYRMCSWLWLVLNLRSVATPQNFHYLGLLSCWHRPSLSSLKCVSNQSRKGRFHPFHLWVTLLFPPSVMQIHSLVEDNLERTEIF